MKSNSLGLHGSLPVLPALRKSKKESMMVNGRQLQVMMVKPKESTPLGLPSTTQEKKAYNDNWFDRLAIHHLSLSVQATTGVKNVKKGYESLTEAASVISRNFGAKGQQELVIQALKRAFPSSILSAIRAIVPQSEFGRLYYATFTTLFFKWLVGPCEVRESEFEGRSERNVVYIHKCRFLESTNCVGMCINLCKIPSQKFIHDSFGMPVHMAPNFEDMSCEMIFGQLPPTDDPALKQPCYQSLCIARNTHDINCSSG